MTVAVGVEEHGAQVLRHAVLLEQLLVGAHEPAVALLDQQLPRLSLGPSDEHVVQSVAVHVGHRHHRPFGREQLRDQRLAVEVDELVFAVDVRESNLVGNVDESRCRVPGTRC